LAFTGINQAFADIASLPKLQLNNKFFAHKLPNSSEFSRPSLVELKVATLAIDFRGVGFMI